MRNLALDLQRSVIQHWPRPSIVGSRLAETDSTMVHRMMRLNDDDDAVW